MRPRSKKDKGPGRAFIEYIVTPAIVLAAVFPMFVSACREPVRKGGGGVPEAGHSAYAGKRW